LFLKGDRCYSDKCAFAVRSYAPGQHGQARKKVSEYGIQLREKQKARRIYGVLERQFHNCFVRAEKQKGITGENLLVMLERRMDNVVYRLGMAESRSQARQLVTHGHIAVNGRRLDIPSALVKAGDVVSVMESSRSKEYSKEWRRLWPLKPFPPGWCLMLKISPVRSTVSRLVRKLMCLLLSILLLSCTLNNGPSATKYYACCGNTPTRRLSA
jgi:ribosomal protein S4